ncbi:MAG: cell wall-binding repeat-containing protein [Actinobacteria bacterium]|nr:cell wall-binding repeat-containing protein [Actinomycetota bacterium]
MHVRRLATALLATLATAASSTPFAAPALASEDYQQVIDATFPTDPQVRFSDTYDACRSDCARVHKATDLMGERMYPLYAMVEGEICGIDDGAEDDHGRHITVCGDDGRRYRYLHLNNDTPGTDDNAAGLEHVYAPGMRRGVRVARGQHIAYMGDSGNAEDTAPHLHLDIFDDRVVDPYGDHRVNPYPTLLAALSRGDIPDGTSFHADAAERVAGEDRIGTSIELARSRFDAAEVALLAPWDSPGEAIVAGPLAAALEAPVLVTHRDRLDPRVADELAALGVTQVYLVGDLLDGIELDLDVVTRLGGGDLFVTAAAVADEVWRLQGAGDPLEHTIEGDAAPPRDPPPVDGEAADDDVASPRFEVAADHDHADPFLLDGARVSGSVHVRLTSPTDEDTTDVAFHLDDPEAEGDPVNVEEHAPWDVGTSDRSGTRSFDTTVLSNGEHTLTAVLTRPDGQTERITASFEVRNVEERRALVALGAHSDPTRSWPDSLMASYYGSTLGRPVLLVDEAALPPATAAALEGVADVEVVGGPAAVTEDVYAEVAALVSSTGRIFGDDRYATAVEVTSDLLERDLVTATRVWAATGRNWPDAATAGPIVSGHAEVLVLVDGDGAGADDAARAFLHRRADRAASGVVIGGPVAVTETVLTAFRLDLT